MFKHRIIYLLLTLFFLTSCIRKVKHIHLDENAGVPVLFSALHNGDTIKVFTGYTVSVFSTDNPDNSVEHNALIVLYRDGIPVDTASSGTDLYNYFHHIPEQGKNYRIQARFPEGQLLRGDTHFPSSLPLNITGADTLTIHNRKVLKVSFHVQDVPGKNYYLVSAKPIGDVGYYYPGMILDKDFPAPPGSEVYQPNYDAGDLMILPDLAFDEQSLDFDLYFENYYDEDPPDRFVIYTAVCDDPYYRYLRFLHLNNRLNNNPFGSMENESPHGNVEGGYGFVGSVMQKSDTLNFN